MRIGYIIAATALALGCAVGHAQTMGQTKLEYEMRERLETAYSDPIWVRNYVKRNLPMYDDERQQKYAKHMMALLSNPKAIDRIIQYSKSIADAKLTQGQMTDYFVEAGVSLTLKGFTRLDDADIETFILMVIDMYESAPPELCKAGITGEIGGRKMSNMEHMWMSKLPPDKFEQVLNLYRRANTAELDNIPLRRTVNDKQAELVNRSLGEKIRKRWAAMPDPTMANRAFAEPKAADPTELCASTVEILKAYLDITGPMRSWALVQYMNETAR